MIFEPKLERLIQVPSSTNCAKVVSNGRDSEEQRLGHPLRRKRKSSFVSEACCQQQ